MNQESHQEENWVAEIAEAMLSGFAWGRVAKEQDGPVRNVSNLSGGLPLAAFKDVRPVFSGGETGLGLLKEVDQYIDDFPDIEDLREYMIDLAVLRMLSEGGEAFLESPEWARVEEETEERGSELLNLLVYLRDCQDMKVMPSLEDFLNEFLLVDEDDFQEEFFIYEEIIRNQSLIEGTLKQIIQTGNNQRNETMAELFTPMMLFFREIEPEPGKLTIGILNQSRLPELHAGLYRALCRFWFMGV
ncbi:MAG: hypothetical protein AAF570_02690 [Bacteroidota bacterium]